MKEGHLQGAITKVGAVLLLIMTGCSAGFQPAPTSTSCEPLGLGVVWETGGPIAPGDVSQHGERLTDELATGRSVRVLVLDQRVAAVSDTVDFSGLDRCGALSGDIRNLAARRVAAEDLRPGIEDALFTAATDSASLFEGRDILGGIERMGRHNPDRLEIWCTGGCIHRTARLDLFDVDLPLDEPLELDVPPQTAVGIFGAGRIPVGDDQTPPLELVEGVIAEWERACEPLTECEVIPQ